MEGQAGQAAAWRGMGERAGFGLPVRFSTGFPQTAPRLSTGKTLTCEKRRNREPLRVWIGVVLFGGLATYYIIWGGDKPLGMLFIAMAFTVFTAALIEQRIDKSEEQRKND
jgi:hypothetical protein